MEILIVIDMQNDFITGSLPSFNGKDIIENIKRKIQNFTGEVFATRDTHYSNYLTTYEGQNLPVEHCIKNTYGWEIIPELKDMIKDDHIFDKTTFGHYLLPIELSKRVANITKIELVGVCTSICVVSNAIILRSYFPEMEIVVDSSCVSCVNELSQKSALEVLKLCQIKVI